jgi:dihydroorotate dehydrogenase electron transfer subunit
MQPAASNNLTRGTFLGEVLANEPLCGDHYRLVLALPRFAPSRPGQFVQLQCRDVCEQVGWRVVDWPPGHLPRFTQPELTDREPLLRRPFSIAARRDRGGGRAELDIIYRTVGTGTRWLAAVKTGAALSLLGPLGNWFTLRGEKPAAVLVGGGVGIPPLLYLAEALCAAGKKTVAFSGARTSTLLPLRVGASSGVSPAGEPTRCVVELAPYGIEAAVATEDGTLGFPGMVSEAFEQWLDRGRRNPDELVVYCCGPEPMMKAVADACAARGIECQVSMERHMACGMGTCQSCICKVRTEEQGGWTFKLCCTDGPVFDARRIIWEPATPPSLPGSPH